MTKGIVYYTDNRLDGIRLREFNTEIFPLVQSLILKSGLPIVSVSLKPINFGKNIVLDLEPSVLTMTKQILAGLEAIDTEYVFFCEHDILYHPSHFTFNPPEKDVFYYNVNGWKWDYRNKRVVTHDHMVGLYGLCASREKLTEHFKKKLAVIYERGYDKLISRNPKWIRIMGYEPGKPIRKGGISNDRLEEWRSEYPNINIRHRRTITPTKMDLVDFIHKPTGWKESTIDQIWHEN